MSQRQQPPPAWVFPYTDADIVYVPNNAQGFSLGTCLTYSGAPEGPIVPRPENPSWHPYAPGSSVWEPAAVTAATPTPTPKPTVSTFAGCRTESGDGATLRKYARAYVARLDLEDFARQVAARSFGPKQQHVVVAAVFGGLNSKTHTIETVGILPLVLRIIEDSEAFQQVYSRGNLVLGRSGRRRTVTWSYSGVPLSTLDGWRRRLFKDNLVCMVPPHPGTCARMLRDMLVDLLSTLADPSVVRNARACENDCVRNDNLVRELQACLRLHPEDQDRLLDAVRWGQTWLQWLVCAT